LNAPAFFVGGKKQARHGQKRGNGKMEINEFSYMGRTFVPHGNIIGKDNETRFHRLMWRTDTLSPLMSKKDGYDYSEFYKIANEAADICYHP
jgi:hypothetical protein